MAMKALCRSIVGTGLASLALFSLAGCGGSTSSLPGLESSATLSGVTVAAGSNPVAGATVNLYLVISQDDLLAELLFPPGKDADPDRDPPPVQVGKGEPNISKSLVLPTPTLVDTTATNGVGRFSFDDLEFGLYDIEIDLSGSSHSGLAPLRFNNRPHLDEEILQELQDAGHLPDDTVGRFMAVFLPPLVGSADIVSNIPGSQVLVFDDGMGTDPLPGLSLFVPPNLQLVKDGTPLADGAGTTLQLALVAPEQVPMSFRDELGQSRTNQLFFSLQPVGVEFVVPGSYDAGQGYGTPMLVQVTYPNVNGLAPGTSVELFRFDHENPMDPENGFRWVAAGTGTVDVTGALVEPDAGAGLPEAGWNGPPGPPPPTITVQGDLKLPDGSVFAQADITIVTNNGFIGFTDATGHYSIPNVPIIGGQTQLICRAFTNLSLTYEVATSDPQPVTFPTTICDIVFALQGSPLDTVPPQVESTNPDHGELSVATDAPVVVTFDELIDVFTLPGSIVIDVAGTEESSPVSGMIIPQLAAPGQTSALFVPDADLAAGTLYDVTVGPSVADLNGNEMLMPYVFSFTTAGGPAGVAQVFSMDPESGPAGTTVEIRGVNLGGVQVSFDGGGVTLNPGGSSTLITFDVPVLTDVAAGDKLVDIDDGSKASASLGSFTFGLLPSIASITPSFGLTGTTVVIAGNNFATDGSNLSATFNSISATLDGVADDAQSVTVDVPAGASSGSVVVTVAAGFASDPGFFTVMAPLDVTAPMLLSSVPADFADLVLVGSTIAMTFDELVATDATVTVTEDDGSPAGVDVSGTHMVSADAMGRGVITFTPDAPFSNDIDVTVVPGMISDLAGNVTVAFSFEFTTEEGAPDPSTLETQLETALDNGDLQDAKSLLEALRDHSDSTATQVDKANLLLAFVDYALVFDTEGLTLAAMAFHTLLADFGFPAGGPDLFDPDSFLAPTTLPSDSPTCDELQDFNTNYGIPSLVALVDALEALPATIDVPFVSPDGLSTVEIDATDVLGLTTMLNKCLADMHCTLAFGCDLDIDALQSGSMSSIDVWNANPTLGTLQSPADLISAQQYIRDTATSYGLTVDSLLAETDDQIDDFITFGMGAEVAQNQAEAETLRSDLNMLSAATLGSVNVTLGDGSMLSVDLSTPFSTLSFRDLIPTLVSDSHYPGQAVSAGHGLLDLNGIVSPGLMPDQLNDVLGLVSQAADPVVTIDLEDDATTDWPQAAQVISDPTGDDEIGGDVANFVGMAVDIMALHVAHDSGSYYFRVDFDGGTPGSDSNLSYDYEFNLESNDSTLNLPAVDGRIDVDPNGGASLSLFANGVAIDLSSFTNPPLAQEGVSFIEWRIPASILGTPPIDIPDASRYILEFEANVVDGQANDFGYDFAGVAEIDLVLP